MEDNQEINNEPQDAEKTAPFDTPQYIQPVYAPPVQVKQKRVGTVTLGITLIFIGIIVPLTMIFKESALQLLSLSPVVLIMLGIEVLYYAVRYKDGKLKYDGLSIFLVVMLTIISIGTASIAPIITRELEYQAKYTQARNTACKAAEDAIMQDGLSGNVSIYDDYRYNDYGFVFGHSAAFDDEKAKFTVNIELTFYDENTDEIKEKAADICYDLLSDIDYNFHKISVNGHNDQEVFRLTTSGDNITKDTILKGLHFVKISEQAIEENQ